MKDIFQTENDNLVNASSKVNDKDLQELSHRKVHYIRYLNLSLNTLSSKGMSHFCKADWSNLINLNIAANKLQGQGCKFLSRCNFKIIRWVDVSHNNIGNSGMMHLSKAKWDLLGQIYLSNNKFTAIGASQLTKANWSKLSIITVIGNRMTPNEQMLALILLESRKIFRLQLNIDWTRFFKQYQESFVFGPNPESLLRKKFGLVQIQWQKM